MLTTKNETRHLNISVHSYHVVHLGKMSLTLLPCINFKIVHVNQIYLSGLAPRPDRETSFSFFSIKKIYILFQNTIQWFLYSICVR